MAIYKPSNCQPFLNSIDLTKEQWLQCEINTSNVRVTGYKIRITTSNVAQEGQSNVVFEGTNYTPIKIDSTTGVDQYGNTALNGSIFSVPFIVLDSAKRGNNPNIILYQNSAYSAIGYSSIPNFSNEYQNQPYRWEITFAQGQDVSSGIVQPPTAEWYDMIVTNGTVLGSTPNRIQTYPSKEVRTDYYIQLKTTGGGDAGGIGRQLITNKDATFGYIYPQEDKITQDALDEAAYYEIYKDTNDINAISPSRVVNYIVTHASNSPLAISGWKSVISNNGEITGVQGTASEATINWSISSLKTKSDVNDYYIEQTMSLPAGVQIKLNTNIKNNSAVGNPYVSAYAEGSGYGDKIISAGVETLLFTAENFKNTSGGFIENSYPWDSTTYLGDNYNGVYEFVSATWQNVPNLSSDGQAVFSSNPSILIRWQRPSQARNIAAYMNGKQWFVQTGSGDIAAKNYGLKEELPAGAGTVINAVPLAFTTEKPIELYPASQSNYGYGGIVTRGQIFKNGELTIGTTPSIRTYIRPFVGLKSGMAFQYYAPNSSGSDVLKQVLNFTLSSDDANGWNPWYITYPKGTTPNNLSVLTPDTTRYKITTYFKSSDENPFYAYSTPVISMEFAENMRADKYRIDNGNIVPIGETYQDEETGIVYPAKGTYLSDVQMDGDTPVRIIQNGITPPERDYGPWIVPFRFVELKGGYSQSQNKSWKNFSWTLYDYNLNTTQTISTQYSGEIQASFDGLQDGHRYQITLTIEDELNSILSQTLNFECRLPDELNEGYFPLNLTFDCATQSVDIEFNKNGIVKPNEYQTSSGGFDQDKTTYKQLDTIGKGYGAYLNGEISDNLPAGLQFAHTELPVKQAGQQTNPISPLNGPLQDSATFNFQTQLSPRFEGFIFYHEIDVAPDAQYEDTKVGIAAYLSPSIMKSKGSDGNVVIVYDGRTATEFNPERNLIQAILRTISTTDGWQTQNPNDEAYDLTIYQGPSGGEPGQWRQAKPITWAWINPDEVPSANCDYLDTTTVYDLQNYSGNTVSVFENENGVPMEHKIATELTYLSPTDLNSSEEFVFPNQYATDIEVTNYPAVWYDRPPEVVTLADGNKVNVYSKNTNKRVWDDWQSKWEDNQGKGDLFIPISANALPEPKSGTWTDADLADFKNLGNNHDGRQEITNKWLLFNIVLEKYDPNTRLAAEQIKPTFQCYLMNSNINNGPPTD